MRAVSCNCSGLLKFILRKNYKYCALAGKYVIFAHVLRDGG